MNRDSLGILCNTFSGGTPSTEHPEYWNGNIPWLSSAESAKDFIYDSDTYITQEGVDNSATKLAKKNSVLIATAGQGKTRGQVSHLENDAYINQSLISITPKDDKILNDLYLYYYLKNSYQRLRNLSDVTGVRGSLSGDLLKTFLIEYPDIKTQNKIVDVLRTIDKKIENNNKISTELESLAKTIYDYWFLQFEFPNEEGKPYKSSGGKMVFNEEMNREIPEGWEIKRLAEIEDNIITGKTPSTKDPENYSGNIPFITIGDIRGNVYVVNTEQNLSEKGANSQSNKYIPGGSLCVTCIATPGLISFASQKSQTNQQINSIIFSKEYNKPFLYFAIKQSFETTAGAKTGNTFANMNKEDFSNIKILYFQKTAKQFYDKVSDFFREMSVKSKENQKLSSLRDWLLPMLMNGQVTFKEQDENFSS